MNCPYYNKIINGMTGLQELQKFQKHLNNCKKSPHNRIEISGSGKMLVKDNAVDMNQALEIRHNSGQ